MSDEKKMPRPCFVDGERCTCHLLFVSCWTHGAGATIGSFPAGQESRSMALVEHEDGSVSDVDAHEVTFADVAGGDR